MPEGGKWAWISLGLACWAIATSILAAYYFVSYNEARRAYEDLMTAHQQTISAILDELSELHDLIQRIKEAGFVEVSLCIDYGNGTAEWHNNTLMPVGSTLFNLTEQATWNLSYVVWPGMGVYVTCINGVCERIITPGHEGYSWIWYYWDPRAKTWIWGPTACDKHVLSDGEVLMWRYEHWAF